MHFHDKHIPIHITKEEEHKRTQLKVEGEVRLALEARHRVEEEEEHAWLEDKEEARLVEEARLKAEEEEKAC